MSDREPGTELARQQPSLELTRYVSPEGLDQIARALPEGVTLAQFDQAFMTAALANPDLAKVEKTSLFLALVNAAKRGLVPDGKQGAIVPFKNKATFIPMIGGVRDTLAEHGWLLVTSVVHENDVFDFDKATAVVSHRPTVSGDRGPVIGAYALAKHRDGRQRMADYMPIEEIHALRDKMGVSANPAWKNWPNQMAEKTVGHRLADDIPLAPQDRRRVDWIITAAELPAEDAAAALYGEQARASFAELPPSSVQPPHTPAAEPVDADTPSVDGPTGSGGVTGDAGAVAAGPSGDDVEPVVTLDDGEPLDASAFVPPTGQFSAAGDLGPLTLSEILELGAQGETWLKWALGKITAPPEYVQAVWAFAASHAPELHAAAVANRKAA